MIQNKLKTEGHANRKTIPEPLHFIQFLLSRIKADRNGLPD